MSASARIIQFGTSRFLQAHVDLFASEAAAAGEAVPPITVVQTSGDAARAGRVAAFARPGGYPVIIRGLDASGAAVRHTVTVRSVAGGMIAARDWTELLRAFEVDRLWVTSNTGDRGYAVDPADDGPALSARRGAPASFPAMLLSLLHHRWRTVGLPATIMPCELVVRNGDALASVVSALATSAGAEPEFIAWLGEQCVFVNSLVDRIVSEPIDPVGAVAEPYALWAVERRPGLEMPFSHPDVVLTDDLEPYERLKLHILNLGHTWLAQQWRARGSPPDLTVREALADPALRTGLERVYADEVVPGFRARGMGDAAVAYVATTMSRFDNPHLDHRLADIATHHDAKVAKRIGGFVDWVDGTRAPPAMALLRGLADRVREGTA